MMIRLKAEKKPWIFCFNPKCPSRNPIDANGDVKKPEPRYTGKSKSYSKKKIAKVK
jgi:hypothetical protein